jgi:hypothetical protein
MPHIASEKIAGNHSTVIDTAVPVIFGLEKLAAVSKIRLGVITQCGNGPISMKVTDKGAALLLKVRGPRTIQEIWIYTSDKKAINDFLDRYIF